MNISKNEAYQNLFWALFGYPSHEFKDGDIEIINEVLGTVAPREQLVLQLRFGLEDGRSRTLKEIGKEFNVTNERIRQIEAKALRRMRKNETIKRRSVNK